MTTLRIVFLAAAVNLVFCLQPAAAQKESAEEHDARMQWWREARFGLFLHWGLYAVPAGEWKGTTTYGEWIRTSAQIPLAEYDRFVGTVQSRPVRRARLGANGEGGRHEVRGDHFASTTTASACSTRSSRTSTSCPPPSSATS